MSAQKPTAFALYKEEYDIYLTDVLNKRRLAHEYLNHFLVTRQPDEWSTFYGYLCEYIGILFHFEETLERITLTAEWDEKEKYWLMDETLTAAFMMFYSTEMVCRQDLLNLNVSFSSH
tara:strand:- start:1288 stop:1641 length:354 start_codon:yes stop_codon:yes gene_type:complete